MTRSKFEVVLAESRVCVVVKVRPAVITPVLLGVFSCGSALDDLTTTAVNTCHRLAEAGETETFKAPFM